MKVLIITNIPNPYRIPLFNELNEQCRQHGMNLKVIFAAETYSRRKFILNMDDCKFDHSFLGSAQHSFGNSERTTFAYGNLSEVLEAEKPDRIIVSGFSLATLKVWWYTRFRNAQFLIWSGSVGMEGKGWPILRKAQRRLLMAYTAAFVVYGERAKKYLLDSGVKSEKIFKGLNTVDTAYFSQQTRILKEKREKEPNKKQLSYVGYLSKRKNVTQLLDCLRLLADKRQDFVLNLIGDGDDKEALVRRVRELGLDEFVRFVGFKQKEELPEFYASTDVFLFQTDFDIWGLVLNEAMSAGLPCIVSPNAGAADDLIIDGQTGFVIDYNEKEKVVKKIIELFDDEKLRKKIGDAAAAFIEEKASLKVSAQGFIEAVKSTMKRN
jgi:glycosyltransferase involved in cell wall biosynthesis